MLPVYHATKYAVEGFSESLCYELEPLNIKVKIVEPGAIDTHFANNMEWVHNEALVEYTENVQKVQNGYSQMTSPENTSNAEYVASIIYKAAIDPSNTLRYIAGKDAENIIELRRDLNDREFINSIKNQFNIQL
mgnify:FL=1